MSKRYLLILIIIFSVMVSCGTKHEIQKEFENYMETVQKGKFDEIKKINPNMNFRVWNVLSELYGKITYKINKIEVNENNAVINVTVKYPDSKSFTEDFSQKTGLTYEVLITKNKEERLEIFSDKLLEFLKEKLKNPDIKYEEKTINVSYEKKGDKWNLSENNIELNKIVPTSGNIEIIEKISIDIKGEIDEKISEKIREDTRKLMEIDTKLREEIYKAYEEFEKDSKNYERYKKLMGLYRKNVQFYMQDIEKLKKITENFIKNVPDYPEVYINITEIMRHMKDYSTGAFYAEKGVEAFLNVDIKKYPEYGNEKGKNYMIKELLTIQMDFYRQSGEYEKAVNLFIKRKDFLKKNTDEIIYNILLNDVKQDNEMIKSKNSLQYEKNNKNLN